MSAPPSWALLADPGAMTPRMSPVPSVSGFLIVCFVAIGDPVNNRSAKSR